MQFCMFFSCTNKSANIFHGSGCSFQWRKDITFVLSNNLVCLWTQEYFLCERNKTTSRSNANRKIAQMGLKLFETTVAFLWHLQWKRWAKEPMIYRDEQVLLSGCWAPRLHRWGPLPAYFLPRHLTRLVLWLISINSKRWTSKLIHGPFPCVLHVTRQNFSTWDAWTWSVALILWRCLIQRLLDNCAFQQTIGQEWMFVSVCILDTVDIFWLKTFSGDIVSLFSVFTFRGVSCCSVADLPPLQACVTTDQDLAGWETGFESMGEWRTTAVYCWAWQTGDSVCHFRPTRFLGEDTFHCSDQQATFSPILPEVLKGHKKAQVCQCAGVKIKESRLVCRSQALVPRKQKQK